jgi:hypothetical protein
MGVDPGITYAKVFRNGKHYDVDPTDFKSQKNMWPPELVVRIQAVTPARAAAPVVNVK